jgi:hypothetical protein
VPQIFHPAVNIVAKASIVGVVLLLGVVGAVLFFFFRSSYVTAADTVRIQPVPFSHQHHAGELGIDCRYCHTTAETGPFAGIPSTKTCMNCHSQIWVGSQMLAPVRESYRTNQSIPWERVHNLADFVYFDHSIHVKKGVGCSTCHGRVDQMPLVYQANSLQMSWCLECHREPERFVRPRDQVFNMAYQAPENQLELGKKLVEEYHIEKLTHCSACHR